MIGFLAKRTLQGETVALLRVYDDERGAQEWTVDGWQPAGLEWTGLGGATEYDNIEVEEAVTILMEFGADELNPVV
ncbi:MAG: hypothetical protein V3S26_02830 [Acidimicrobiia bacterium]